MKTLKAIFIILLVWSLVATGLFWQFAGKLFILDHLILGLPEMFLSMCVALIFAILIGIINSIIKSKEISVNLRTYTESLKNMAAKLKIKTEEGNNYYNKGIELSLIIADRDDEIKNLKIGKSELESRYIQLNGKYMAQSQIIQELEAIKTMAVEESLKKTSCSPKKKSSKPKSKVKK